jgi:dihydroneopterin aldolase
MYPQEKILGNTFVINAKVGIEYKKVDNLNETVDYERILHIIQYRCEKPTPLLEELVYLIEQDVLKECPSMKSFYLSIQKMNPPLGANVKSSEVSIERTY